ncbi:MAG TPA: cyanophycinase [Burkholderiaceae bacterium]|jgi:cyanophycinase
MPYPILRSLSVVLTLALPLLVLAATPVVPVTRAGSAPQPDAQIKGYAIAIGGALKNDNDEVWQRIVNLAGGKGARFVVFGTASEDPEASAKQVVDLLQRRGAVAESLPVAPKFAWVDLNKVVRDPALIAKVRNARGVFFTGGSQERIVDVLIPGGKSTPMLDAVWEVYRKGGVVAGTSAGAAIMSTVMFRDAPSVIDVMKGKWSDGKQVDRGLGFVGPDLFVDQHFLRRGRVGRMIPLMMAKGYKLGLGVDENTAAIIHGEEIEIIGGRGALLVDLNDIKSDPTLGAFNVSNARLSYLDHGDRYNVHTRAIAPGPIKLRGEKLAASEPGFDPYYTEERFDLDILGDSTLANAMAQLVDSKRPDVQGLAFDPRAKPTDTLSDLGFHFKLYKGDDTVGWSTTEAGAEEYTVENVYLDITPVRVPQPLFSAWNRDDRGAPPSTKPQRSR